MENNSPINSRKKWFRFQKCRLKFRSLFFNFHFLKILEMPFLISQRLKCLRAKSVFNGLTNLKRQSKTSWRFLGFFLFSFSTVEKYLLNFDCWKWFEKSLKRIFDCFGCWLTKLENCSLAHFGNLIHFGDLKQKRLKRNVKKWKVFWKINCGCWTVWRFSSGTAYNSKQEKFGFRVFYERF